MSRISGSLPLVVVAVLLAGCGQGGTRESAAIEPMAGADPSMVGEPRLPAWHPPVMQSGPRLPEGHPMLPKGHPLLGGQGACPGQARGEGWGRGAAPAAVDEPVIVST